MTVHPFFDHPLARRLAALGFRLEPWSIAAGGALAGLRFCTRSNEVVIRFDAPDTLRVVLYKRLSTRQGTGNAFRDFVWLVFEARDHGIDWVIGVISPAAGVDADTLPASRIAAFYTRYLGAVNIGYEMGSEIIRGDLSIFERVWKKRPPVPQPAGD